MWSSDNGSRDDLGVVARIGANYIAPRNWSPLKNHTGFLQYCALLNVSVAVPIHNDLLATTNVGAISAIVREVRLLPVMHTFMLRYM